VFHVKGATKANNDKGEGAFGYLIKLQTKVDQDVMQLKKKGKRNVLRLKYGNWWESRLRCEMVFMMNIEDNRRDYCRDANWV